jgi:hypothetical protein
MPTEDEFIDINSEIVDSSEGVKRVDTSPFGISTSPNYNTEGSVDSYDYSFNQAYIFNAAASGALSRKSSAIAGMQDGLSISREWGAVEFKVEVFLDKQNLNVNSGSLITGEPSEAGVNTGDFTYPLFDYKAEDNEGEFVLVYPVCTVQGGATLNYTLRDNIYLDNHQFKQMGDTGNSTDNEGGIGHIMIESGRSSGTNPIMLRAISGGSGIQVRYSDDSGNYIIIDQSSGAASADGSGAWTGENVGSETAVYVDGTGPNENPATKAQFRTLKSSSDGTSYDPEGSNAALSISPDGENIDFSLNLQGLTQAGIPEEYKAFITSSPATGAVALGGISHVISGNYNVITAGAENKISGGQLNFIGGGSGNDVNWSRFSSSLGGKNNDISGANYSVLLGGDQNLIKTGHAHFIGGGVQNKISGSSSIISSAIVGGTENKILGATYSFIGAGATNTVYANNSVIGGGTSNIASGDSSVVFGGSDNKVLADYGVAAGRYSTVQENHDGAFVLSDSNVAETLSSGANTLTLNFKSGVYVDSDSGIYINGNPVMTGSSPEDVDTLQTVTDRGNTTTNSVYINGSGDSVNYAPLNVSGGSTLGFLRGTGTVAYLQFQNSTTSYGASSNHGLTVGNNGNDAYVFQREAAPLYLGTSGEARITIAADGKVGIGTLSPAELLHVDEGYILADGASTNHGFELRRDAYDTFQIRHLGGNFTINNLTDTRKDISIDGDGNVGIGSAVPTYNLDLTHGSTIRINSGAANSTAMRIGGGNNDVTLMRVDSLGGTTDKSSYGFSLKYMGTRSSQANSLSIFADNVTAGTQIEAVTIDQSGLVGIGITNPDNPLEVWGSDNGIKISSAVTDRPRLTFDCDSAEKLLLSANSTYGAIGDSSDTNRYMVFKDGDVGIGTNAPAATLDVDGGIKLLDNNYLAWRGSNTRMVANSDYLQIQVAASDTMRLTSAGNVGIGTVTPSGVLHVYNTGSSFTDKFIVDGSHGRLFNVSDETTGIIFSVNDAAGLPVLEVDSTSGYDKISIGEYGTNALVVSGSNVGISNSNPQHSLDVSGDAAFAQYIYHQGDEDTNIKFIDDDIMFNVGGSQFLRLTENASQNTIFFNGDAEDIDFKVRATGPKEALFVRGSDGEVGINTTNPTSALHVAGNVRIKGASSDGVLMVENVGATQALRIDQNSLRTTTSNDLTLFTDGNTSQLRLNQANGYVGILNTSPQYELHVSGDVGGTGAGGRITLNGTGYLISGDAEANVSLQEATDNGNTTTNSIISTGPYISGVTGLFSHVDITGTDTLTVSGNVGIGTASPSTQLDVAGTGAFRRIDILDSTYNANPRLTVGRNTGEQINFYIDDVTNKITALNDTDEDGPHKFILDRSFLGTGASIFQIANNGNHQLTIDEDGNVGIGTNAPKQKFVVTARSNFDSQNEYYGSWIDGNTAGDSFFAVGQWYNVGGRMEASSTDLKIYTHNTAHDILLQADGGKVGIGSYSPAHTLDVVGDVGIVGEDDYNITIIGNTGTHPTQGLAGGRIIGPAARRLYFELLGNDATDHFRFLTSPNDDQAADYVAVHIGNDGNVGIGTIDPFTTLHVVDTDSAFVAGDVPADTVAIFENSGNSRVAIIADSDDISDLFFGDQDDGDVGRVRYNHNSNYMAFFTNASEKMRIEAGGDVGIATDSPSKQLQVGGSNPWLRLQEDDSGGDKRLDLWVEGSTGVIGANQSAQTMMFQTIGNTQMTITDAGRVGIGIQSPTSSALLQVTGDIFVGDGTAGAGGRNFLAYTASLGVGKNSVATIVGRSVKVSNTTNNSLVTLPYSTDGTLWYSQGYLKGHTWHRTTGIANGVTISESTGELMRLTTGGYVGIGVTDPDTPLHVKGNIRAEATASTSFADFKSSQIWAGSTYDIIVGTSNPLNFRTNDIKRMTIEGGGDVGIGTTAPSGTLHVETTDITGYVADSYADLIVEDSDARIQVVSDNAGSNGSALILTNVNGSAHSNWAFGQTTTSQSNKLHIGHNTEAGGDVSSYTTTQDLTITTDGTVGIGSFSPSFKLDVVTDVDDGGIRIHNTAHHASVTVHSDNSYNSYLRFRDDTNRYWLQCSSDDHLYFRPNAIDPTSGSAITFSSGGNIGIGSHAPTERLEVAPDTDVSAIIGKAHVGYIGQSDSAGFAHVDYDTSSNYALKQNSVGNTMLNVKAGGSIGFNIANTTVAAINNGGDFFVDTDTLFVDASTDRVGINDSSPSYALDVNGTIRSQTTDGGGLKGLNSSARCTTIEGYFANTSTEDYGFQNPLLANSLAGLTEWSNVTMVTSGLYGTRGGTAGSYTYSAEKGTGDFDSCFRGNNSTVSVYADGGVDGTGMSDSGVIELFFPSAALNYSTQVGIVFGGNQFRATDIKIEVARTGGWQTELDIQDNTETAVITRVTNGGGGSNITGIRYTLNRSNYSMRINQFYAADYNMGTNADHGGAYYIDKYYDGRHYATLRPVRDGGADLGTESYNYDIVHANSGNFTNGITIDGNPVVTGTSAEDVDTLQTVTDRGATTTNSLTISSNNLLLSDSHYVRFGNTNYRIQGSNGGGYLKLYAGGLEALTIDSSRNVGIGTTDPMTTLHIQQSDGSYPDDANNHLVVESSSHSYIGLGGGTASDVGIHFGDSAAMNQGRITYKNSDDSLRFTTSGVNDRMVITSAGNVGIGTTAPERPLDVGGSAIFKSEVEVQQGVGAPMLHLRPNAASTAINPIILYRNQIEGSANYMLCAGTQTYFGTYDGGGVPTDQSKMIRISPSASDAPSLGIGDAGSAAAYLEVGGNIKLLNNGTSYINGGDVGIGTNAPAYKLDIQDAAAEIAQIKRTNGGNCEFLINPVGGDAKVVFQNSGTDIWAIGKDNSDSSFRISEGGALETNPRFTVDNGGNVGIGTTDPYLKFYVDGNSRVEGNLMVGDAARANTPSVALHIKSSSTNAKLRIEDSDSSNQYWDFYVNQGDGLHFNEDTETRVTFKEGGNVGIGTSAPSGTLSVGPAGFVAGYTSSRTTLLVGDTSNGSELILRGKSPRIWFDATSAGSGQMFLDNVDFNVLQGSPISEGDSRFFIKSDGNVGIGTTSPDAHLNIYNTGTTSSAADVHIVGSGNTYGLLYERLRNDSMIVSKSTTAGSYFKTDSATSSYQGYAIGDNWFMGQYGYNDFRIVDGTKSAGTAALTIQDTTKYVGIGTTTPATELEVYGVNPTIRISDSTDPVGDGTTIGKLQFYGSDGSSAGVDVRTSIETISENAAGNAYRLAFLTSAGNASPTEKVTIKSDGNVGIGTTNPDKILHVFSTVNNGAFARIESTATDSYPTLSLKNDAREYQLTAGGHLSDAFTIYDGTVGAHRLTIASDGKVGIGLTNPAHTLHVSGSVAGTGIGDRITLNGTGYLLSGDAEANVSLQEATDNGNTTTNSIIVEEKISGVSGLFSSGVGIGTATPHTNQQLHIYGDGAGLEFSVDAQYANATRILSYNRTAPDAGYKPFHLQSSELRIDTNGSRSMTVSTAGDVGIGSAVPARKLDVVGDAQVSTNLIVGTALYTNQWIASAASVQQIKNSVGNTLVTISTGGDVGIGTTSPSRKLEVFDADDWQGRFSYDDGRYLEVGYQGILATYGTNGNNMTVGTVSAASDAGHLRFKTINTERVRITNSGEVGIGTETPSGTLHVYNTGSSFTDKFIVDGSHGRLFNVADETTGIVFSVNDAAGLPIIEVDSTSGYDKVSIGEYGTNALVVSGSGVGIGVTGSRTEVLEVYPDKDESAIIGKVKVGDFGDANYASFGYFNLADNSYAIRQHSNGNTHLNAGTSRNIEFRGGLGASSTQGMFTASSDFFVGPQDTDNTLFVDVSETSVGIGTTVPAATLDIWSANGTNAFNIIQGGESAFRFSTYLEPTSSDTPVFRQGIYYNTTQNATIAYCRGGSSIGGFLTFQTHSGIERMRIDSDGNVGIGTTNPQKALEISKTTAGGGGVLRLAGIGESSQNDVVGAIEFFNGDTTDNTAGVFGIIRGVAGPSGGEGSLQILTDMPSEGADASTIAMHISSHAKIGIGTTVPAARLDVRTASQGDTAFEAGYGSHANLAVGTDTSFTKLNIASGNYHHSFLTRTSAGASSERFVIEGGSDTANAYFTNSYVGIGTNAPSYELDVVGTTRSTYYVGGAYLEENASSSKLKFYTNGSVLVMDEDGSLKPCEKENDTLVFGVSKKDFDQPIVLGAEPVLITGPIKVGDYIVTSSKQGHGQAMKEEKLGTIIAQAMENGDGESYNIKAMIRKI